LLTSFNLFPFSSMPLSPSTRFAAAAVSLFILAAAISANGTAEQKKETESNIGQPSLNFSSSLQRDHVVEEEAHQERKLHHGGRHHHRRGRRHLHHRKSDNVTVKDTGKNVLSRRVMYKFKKNYCVCFGLGLSKR
jgi:hypothetical protein